jgi:hypothetical protein
MDRHPIVFKSAEYSVVNYDPIYKSKDAKCRCFVMDDECTRDCSLGLSYLSLRPRFTTSSTTFHKQLQGRYFRLYLLMTLYSAN